MPNKPAPESRYKSMGERAAAGQFELVEPLDYFILEELPPEGTTFADMYQIGTTVRDLAVKWKEKGIPSTALAARIRSLNVQGLVKKVKTVAIGGSRADRKSSSEAAWQRTKRGQELLDTWKESSNGNS